MFFLSLCFLFLLGALIVIEVDIPRVTELRAIEAGVDPDLVFDAVALAREDGSISPLYEQYFLNGIAGQAELLDHWVLWTLLAIWPLFWIEYALTIWPAGGNRGYLPGGFGRLLVCLAPPLRLAAASPDHGFQIWLPTYGWQHPGRQLSRGLERNFGKPMLAIALLILPILAIEYGMKGLLERHAWLQVLLHVSTGLIWFAFAVEFIIMVNATDRKLAYIKKHWVDLAIILLPLISFLRSLRALRLARLARVQKLVKIGRIYRMRGLVMKLVRALLLYEVVHRLLGINPQKKLVRLRNEYDERLEDLEELRSEIRMLEKEVHRSDRSIQTEPESRGG